MTIISQAPRHLPFGHAHVAFSIAPVGARSSDATIDCGACGAPYAPSELGTLVALATRSSTPLLSGPAEGLFLRYSPADDRSLADLVIIWGRQMADFAFTVVLQTTSPGTGYPGTARYDHKTRK